MVSPSEVCAAIIQRTGAEVGLFLDDVDVNSRTNYTEILGFVFAPDVRFPGGFYPDAVIPGSVSTQGDRSLCVIIPALKPARAAFGQEAGVIRENSPFAVISPLEQSDNKP